MGHDRTLRADVLAGLIIGIAFCAFAGAVLALRGEVSASINGFLRLCVAYLSGGALGGFLYHFSGSLSTMRGGKALRGFVVSLPSTLAFVFTVPDEPMTLGARIFAALFVSVVLGAGIGQALIPR